MENFIIFCQDRNKFYKGESNGFVRFTKDNKEAASFESEFDAEKKIVEIDKAIIVGSPSLIAVHSNFERYN